MSRSHSPSKKKHKKSKKHKRDSSSDTSSGHEKKKKHKKHKKKKDSEKKHSKTKRESETQSKPAETSGEPLFEFQARRLKETSATLARLPAATPKAIVESNPEEKARVSGPMSKQDYDKVNSQIREVRDPKTGRVRLVRGEGEILEQIVSKEEQQKIRRLATTWDGVMMYGAPS